jgi:hypothetical protein
MGKKPHHPKAAHLRGVDPIRKDGAPQVTPAQAQMCQAVYEQVRAFFASCRVKGTEEELHQAAFRAAQDMLGLQQLFVLLSRPMPRPFEVHVIIEGEPVIAGADWDVVADMIIDARGLDASLYDMKDEGDRERFVMTHAATGIVSSPSQRGMCYLRKRRLRIVQGEAYVPPKTFLQVAVEATMAKLTREERNVLEDRFGIQVPKAEDESDAD